MAVHSRVLCGGPSVRGSVPISSHEDTTLSLVHIVLLYLSPPLRPHLTLTIFVRPLSPNGESGVRPHRLVSPWRNGSPDPSPGQRRAVT